MATGKKKRESFLKLFNRTCENVFIYSFECTLNRADACIISRNAFVYMYQTLGNLRKSSSVDAWQRDCVRQSFRSLIRSNRLSMLQEKEEGENPAPLSASEREDLWNAINKYGDIDPWRLVPIPGKTSAFTVWKDKYVSSLSNRSVADIGKTVLIVVGSLAVVGIGVYAGFKIIGKNKQIQVDPMEEIFLEERSYSVSSRENAQVDYDELEKMVSSAEKEASWLAYQSKLESIANMSSVASAEYVAASSDPLLYAATATSSRALVYASAQDVGITARSAILTGEAEIDDAVAAMINEIDLSAPTDAERIWNIYNYVGTHITYSDDDTASLTVNDYIKFYLLRGSGDSRHYSALLSAVLNACGYQSEVVSGYFVLNGGTSFEKNVRHYWTRTIVNGGEYFLDLEADCDAAGTKVRNYYFLATRGNAKWDVYERDHVLQ